jgi:hypothetical protein
MLKNEETIVLRKDLQMKLSPPKVVTWWISVVLAVIGALGVLGVIGSLGVWAIWLLIFGFALLAIACITKGL